MLILAIIAAVLAVAALLFGIFARFEIHVPTTRDDQDGFYTGGGYKKSTTGKASVNTLAKLVAAGLALLTAVFLFFASFYTQDVGEAKVLKDWTGNIIGEDITPGAALKAPWVDAIDFDIRNQQATYIGDGSTDHNGGKASGAQITVQDREGVQANFDVAVRYSVRPDAVTEIYAAYQTQENFRARLIDQDIRSVVRNAPSKYGTIDVLTKRGEIETAIFDGLSARWESKGVLVESVALQEIRYPEDVKQKFADAQNARTEVVKAQAELEAAEVSSQQKIVQAEAEAKANETLAKSLTDPILRQRYLDTLGKLAEAGNLVITDGSGDQIINIPAKP